MSSITSSLTTDALRGFFAAYGLPEEVVSDNGPQIIYFEFTEFLKRNGIKHTRVPAYHPASNGAVEWSVQILKQSLRKRTRFSLLKPDLAKHVQEKQKQQKQKKQHDGGKKVLRSFVEEELVRGQEKCNSATVIERKGPVGYCVQEGERRRIVHVDQMLPRNFAEGFPVHEKPENPNPSVTDDNRVPMNFPIVRDSSMQINEPEISENPEPLKHPLLRQFVDIHRVLLQRS